MRCLLAVNIFFFNFMISLSLLQEARALCRKHEIGKYSLIKLKKPPLSTFQDSECGLRELQLFSGRFGAKGSLGFIPVFLWTLLDVWPFDLGREYSVLTYTTALTLGMFWEPTGRTSRLPESLLMNQTA